MDADPLTFVGATELEAPEHSVVPSPEQQVMDEPSFEVLEEARPSAELPSGVARRRGAAGGRAARRRSAVRVATRSAGAPRSAGTLAALSSSTSSEGTHHNVAVLRTNSMKYLPNFFRRGQLRKLFFCFPDPHFKAKNHRRRIVSESLLSEYAYALDASGAGRLAWVGVHRLTSLVAVAGSRACLVSVGTVGKVASRVTALAGRTSRRR